MLTIREPIRLKTGRPIQGIRQDIAARIEANYGLMNLAIRKEELLHITSQPAEIYFADSENFQILTNINNQNQQEVRLEVINNLMNRILVAQTENFTYQDTVYISNVLRKMGIRDEKNFMKQVFELQNEHKETKQLLQSYEKNQEVLKQLLKTEGETGKPEVREQQTITKKERRYYIHDEIFKRLETGKIYQDMRQFSKTYLHESLQINPCEMQIAEQTKLSQNFLLQNIKNGISGKTPPLYYLHNNRYEYLQEITETMSQNLEEQITAAILLNLSEQSYVLRQSQIEKNSHNWYSIAKSLFQTSENTLRRYEMNLVERKQFSFPMLQLFEELKEVKHLEGEIIHNIVEEYYHNLQQWKEETNVNNHILNLKNIQEEKEQSTYFSGGSYYLTQEEFQLNYLPDDDARENQNELFLTTEQLQKQLEIYNQKNYENYLKILEIEKQQKKVKDRKVNRRKAQMDALRALEKPEEVLIEYLTTENKDSMEEATEKMSTRIYELFSEETKEIYRQFLVQNNLEHTTFLEYIMKQPHEDEIRREVIEVLEQIEKQESVVRTNRDKSESIQQQKLLISQELKEKVFQQLVLWKEIQDHPILELKEEIYLQNKIRDEIHTMEVGRKNFIHEIESEKYFNSTSNKNVNETMETQLTLLKNMKEGEIVHIPETEYSIEWPNEVFQKHEIQYVELKENVERQIKRQQEELTVVNTAVQKEVRRQQVEFVHKIEEQVINEELLEEIRQQNQTTIKTQQTEETTVQNQRDIQQIVQDSINKIQVNRVDNIEEMVQQSVKRQLNSLSDQVYGKLEKKLQTERKRRGYF